MTTQNLLVELFVEELPPKALKKLGDAFAFGLATSLANQDLVDPNTSGAPIAYASPRRLAVWIRDVLTKAENREETKKLMPVNVGMTAEGVATPALMKRLQGMGIAVSDPVTAVAEAKLFAAPDGKAEALFISSLVPGVELAVGLQKALDEALAKLPIPKVMSYQLESDCELPGWSSVHFVRPAHGLVALHGSTVVPVKALGLTAGNITHGHRFEAAVDPVVLADADHYAETLLRDGAVLASFNDRRFAIVQQLAQAAERLGPGFEVLMDEALLDEVTALVERPNVLTCGFDAQFLDVPQECLILTMKANQKYFPLVDTQGKLTNQFLVVSNISPEDASAVIGGNERVVRPRLADAKFFFDQDRKKTLASRVEGLGKVVYHNKLGTQGERVERVRAIAGEIALELRGEGLGDGLQGAAEQASMVAKADLLTDMVGEFPELQGIMGGYYARHDGLSEEVALAVEDHYKPRFAGDELPRNAAGVVVALADKLETLVGMFAIGNLPTGDKDPFALRRHALGVIRMLTEKSLHIGLSTLLAKAARAYIVQLCKGEDTPVLHIPAATAEQLMASLNVRFGVKGLDGSELQNFIYDRLAGSLREQGYSAQEVDAVLALRPQRLADVGQRLQAVRAFAALPAAAALAAANKRIGNILKKSEGEGAAVQESLLVEAAEQGLFAAMQATVPAADAEFANGDYTASLMTLAALRVPVDAFFDGVMVNAEDAALKANRLGLLKNLHEAMNRVADLSRLAA